MSRVELWQAFFTLAIYGLPLVVVWWLALRTTGKR